MQVIRRSHCLVFAVLLWAPGSHAQQQSQPLRVGIVAVEDFAKEHAVWQRTLTTVSERSGSEFRPMFSLAIGTYGDLLHWMDKGWIDLAVLSPGIYAEALNRAASSDLLDDFTYLATIGAPAATSKWATDERRRAGFHYTYHSVCAVAADSRIHSVQQLQSLARQNLIDFIFVHPLSMSGRVVPEKALRDVGITPTTAPIEYSYSHTRSLELLQKRQSDEARERVAFVWDDALDAAKSLADDVRSIPFPRLQRIEIAQDVILVRKSLADAPLCRQLAEFDSEDFRLRRLDGWRDRYGQLAQWSRQVREPMQVAEELHVVSASEIGQMLVHAQQSFGRPPRLALVMSGGGAKCSYQVGAVSALEQQLGELRESYPELDIDLVVGTSGGAINAIPVAMGITKSSAGADDFQQVWKQLDQRTIVQPAPLVRANIGMWFAILQIACVLGLVRCLSTNPNRRVWSFSAALLTIGLVQLLIGYIPLVPWRLLGTSHIVHHFWLWCSLGIRWSAWCLAGVGLVGMVVYQWRSRRGDFPQLPRRRTIVGFVFALVALPLIQIVTVLFFQETLSGGEGVERSLAEKFPVLINQHLKRHGERELDLAGADDGRERLKAISHDVIDRGLLQRDLVITGNCLEQSSGELPSDLYFFARAKSSSPPPFGRRGVSLMDHPNILMDVVMGSSAIFPLFPPRRIDDLPEKDEYAELIDGGFAHNSPIEAAVLWGATHVILIEATPAKRGARSNLAHNAAAAFTHLHKQTQLVDLRSKQQVVVFTLTPEAPHLCVLDFADNLIERSMERGYRDARVDADGRGVLRRFRKELGEPVFTYVKGETRIAE